jgi:hypothetical protein
VRPFKEESISQLMAEKISGFSNNNFKIMISSGPIYPPIPIVVHEFCTSDLSFLAFKKIMTDQVTKVPQFIKVYAPPLGITDFNQDLEGKLKSHIQSIVEGKRNYGEVVYGDTSQLTWEVFEAIRQYQRANPAVTLLLPIYKVFSTTD